MRPSFRVHVDSPAERLRRVIEARLILDAAEVEGDLSSRHGVLRIPADKRHFWTPCLELTLAESARDESGEQAEQSSLWGTFSPRAEIWTAFVFTIGTLVVISLFATLFGVAQLVLGHPPFALLLPVAAVFAAGLLYVSALVGQGLSISEMYRLRAFVDDCLREAEAGSSLRVPRESRVGGP